MGKYLTANEGNAVILLVCKAIYLSGLMLSDRQYCEGLRGPPAGNSRQWLDGASWSTTGME